MTRFSQSVSDRIGTEEHRNMMRDISSEFGDEMLKTLLLLNARLMGLSMSDLKSVVISVVARDETTLILKRDSENVHFEVSH
ncbi:hypothetical protein [Erwinia persicina]|uniref:hypothetical protein n=1 Tax=Erwinia persicina TaxID=55211 RepID=UPI0017859489|nr:hypothetical protein [Erwinia persicina]MBD8214409.1 hypothetical protein [Erwinia persicina]